MTQSTPRDAATLVLVDSSGPAPRILMGQRRFDLAFMPGKYVFPGGRVDDADNHMAFCQDLAPRDLSRLLIDMKGEPGNERARALALAAVRETFEETGLMIGGGEPSGDPAAPPGNVLSEVSNAPSSPDTAANMWRKFRTHNLLPRLDGLTYFARAITPPGRTRRYDTRFFCADATAISHDSGERDDELLTLHWLTLDETRDFDLASITRIVLEDLSERLAGQSGAPPVPYYYFRNSSFCRELLD